MFSNKMEVSRQQFPRWRGNLKDKSFCRILCVLCRKANCSNRVNSCRHPLCQCNRQLGHHSSHLCKKTMSRNPKTMCMHRLVEHASSHSIFYQSDRHNIRFCKKMRIHNPEKNCTLSSPLSLWRKLHSTESKLQSKKIFSLRLHSELQFIRSEFHT